MNLKAYLNEELNDYDKIKKLLISECSIFLKELKGCNKFLYRGVNENFSKITKQDVRKNRKPKSSSLSYHNYLNKFFQYAYKIPLRSESIFCTGDIRTSEMYGNVFIVFPLNNYKIYWSLEICDLFTIRLRTGKCYAVLSKQKQLIIDYFMLKFYYDYMEYNKNMEKKFYEEYKLMFNEPYDETSKNWKNIYSLKFAQGFVFENMKQFYKIGDLKSAINSLNEIMLHTSQVFYIPLKYHEQLKKDFL